MELWIEYLQRHGLPIVRPQEPFIVEFNVYVPPRPPVEHKIWAFFLMNNSHLIANHSYDLEEQVNEWCDGLLVVAQTDMPSLNEQQDIVFGNLPYMEYLWGAWQSHAHLFTSSLTSGSAPTAHRSLFVPAQRHP